MLRRITLAAAVTAAASLGSAAPTPVLDQACAVAASSLAPAAATGQGRNHALVIVDTGTAVHRTCVSFDSESITGKQALELAGAEPVFKEFSGLGSFVCKLHGTGREVGDCVGDPTYWVYSRAPAGTTAFTASEVGVSTSQVRHGDVEGWKWATEGAPQYAAPEDVCSDEQAARMPVATQRPPDSRADDSAWPAVAGFAATLAVVAGAWLFIRRRNT